jgi:hypothetical protein
MDQVTHEPDGHHAGAFGGALLAATASENPHDVS